MLGSCEHADCKDHRPTRIIINKREGTITTLLECVCYWRTFASITIMGSNR